MAPKASIEYPAGKILYQILVPADMGPTKKIPPMPTDIVGALADQDQFLEVHLRLAAGINEVLNGATLHDSINKGFSFDANLQYLRCLKKILKQVPKLDKAMDIGGFGLKLGMDASVNLTYDDLDELKENDFASKVIDQNIDSAFEQFGIDKDELLNFQTEVPDSAPVE